VTDWDFGFAGLEATPPLSPTNGPLPRKLFSRFNTGSTGHPCLGILNLPFWQLEDGFYVVMIEV